MKYKKCLPGGKPVFSLNIPAQRVQQFFKNIKKWDLYWFGNDNSDPDQEVNMGDPVLDEIVNSGLARGLHTIMCFLVLDSGDIQLKGKHGLALNFQNSHTSVNTQLFSYLRNYYSLQFLSSEVLVSIFFSSHYSLFEIS